MYFEVIGGITGIQPIAAGRVIREIERLRRIYGGTRWRKMKGRALIRLATGTIRQAELHWYECHGVGRREMKIKRLLS